jgi:hypothetical protein
MHIECSRTLLKESEAFNGEMCNVDELNIKIFKSFEMKVINNKMYHSSLGETEI